LLIMSGEHCSFRAVVSVPMLLLVLGTSTLSSNHKTRLQFLCGMSVARCCSDQRDSLPHRLRLLGASQAHTTSNLPYSTRINFVSLFVFVEEPHLGRLVGVCVCVCVCVRACYKPCACRCLCSAAGCLAKHLQHNTAVVPVTAGN
jgi:hypothetical protein